LIVRFEGELALVVTEQGMAEISEDAFQAWCWDVSNVARFEPLSWPAIGRGPHASGSLCVAGDGALAIQGLDVWKKAQPFFLNPKKAERDVSALVAFPEWRLVADLGGKDPFELLRVTTKELPAVD
jgi:hypothetical protein